MALKKKETPEKSEKVAEKTRAPVQTAPEKSEKSKNLNDPYWPDKKEKAASAWQSVVEPRRSPMPDTVRRTRLQAHIYGRRWKIAPREALEIFVAEFEERFERERGKLHENKVRMISKNLEDLKKTTDEELEQVKRFLP